MISPNKIKNIIFDLGGVILNIDYHITLRSFEALGIQDFEKIFTDKIQEQYFHQYEMGNISTSEMMDSINSFASTTIDTNSFLTAWNSMLLDLPLARINILKNLKQKGFRLFLLSNINEMHHDAFQAIATKVIGEQIFNTLFEKTYYSHIMGDRKPNASSYQTILNNHDLTASETLFVDDLLPNIEAAKIVGLQTEHIQPTKSISQIFENW